MDAKRLTPILLAVLLASLAFPAKSEAGGGDVETSAGGSLRRRPDGEEMFGSSKIHIVLCTRNRWCQPDHTTCYCCETLLNTPCYATQQECRDICPSRQQQQAPALHMPPALAPAPAVASSIIEEPRRSVHHLRAVPDWVNHGEKL